MGQSFSAIGGFVGALPEIFSYLFRYDKLIQSLRVQVESLDDERASLQRRVDAARRNLQDIDRGVLEWLERVEKIKQDSDNLVGAVLEDQNGACLNRSCPKPKLRYSQSRQATKLTATVVELLEKSDKFQTISYPPPPMGIEAIPAPSGTHEFQSRKEKEEEIMACLKNDTIFMIGVCGMGGVGKTTMAKKIWRRASEEKIFDEIVMTEGLGQDADQLKIQQQIAGGLGLELTKDTRTNCSRILQRLTGKNVLLVLDDVWERLDLEELGIPSQSMNKGCKIILTTRNDRVCIESTKDGKRNLSLEVLREEETWSLFRDKAGSVVDQDDLRELAIDVAKECKGLPVALATVGIALRERTNIAVWMDALSELQNALPTNIPGVLEVVYQPLQLSYKALKSPEARYLFLICCLFPEDSRIDLEDLVHYGIGLGIFSNIRNLREARNRVCGLVDTLKSRFLLMDATYNDDDDNRPRVKMHDVVRDMAIWISSQVTEITLAKHVLFMVSHDIWLSEWPIKDSCENYTAISLTLGKSIVNIPECMNCPRLESLLVDCTNSDEAPELPNMFFDRMSGLRLLSISNCIVDLSSSLSLLTQLRVLRLYRCRLKRMISFIDEFVNLEILCLHDSDIEVLPYHMGALTKLKLLDLNGCYNLNKIAPGVISRLVQLEELRLLRCPVEWGEGGEEKRRERSNASVVEVFSLRNLRALEIWIQDPPHVIPHDYDRGGQLQEQELTSYHVIIGKRNGIFDGRYIDRKRMEVDVDEMGKSFVHSMCVLLMGAEHLYLRGKGSKDIIEVLERQGFQNVKELEISSLDTATALIQLDIAPTRGSAIFPVLRRLHLSYMDDLEEICDGPPTLGSFFKLEEIKFFNLSGLMYLWKCSNEKLCLPNLKMLNINGCSKLKWVFPLSIAKSLCQLETIEIRNCPNMEEVFFKDEIWQGSLEEEDGDNSIKFPKLKEMILQSLPKLSALCKAGDVFEFPSITTLQISHVSWWNLKMLGSQGLDLFNKEVPYIDVFTGLHKLSISYCSELRTLFSSDAFKSLINLKELSVSNCLILEEIFEKQKDEEKVLNLPQLESLELSELPKIRCFCNFKNTLELPSLKEITITNCPMMETFAVESCSTRMSNSIPKFFFSKEVTCPNLRKLGLHGIRTGSVIFSPEFQKSELKLEVTYRRDFKSEANPWERQTKMTNLELERNLPLEPLQNESNSSASATASEGSLTGNNPEPSVTGFLPYIYEVEPEAERGPTAAEQSRSMDSPLQVTVSVAGELSNYMDLKFETLYGLSSSKGQNATNEFNYCDFTSEADNYHILMRKKTSVKLPEHLIWNEGVTSLTSPPEEEKWRQACVMVLRDNSFHSLPQEPDCPNLVLLLLQRSICLRKIPESFFSLMHSLGILDLSDSRMSSLPSSLFRLHKLQVLRLRNCKFLDKLPNEVKGLVLLEDLDLFGTELNDVPDEIGDLIHLRDLQLTFYGSDDESEYAHLPLNFFSQNIISRLQSLETLSIVVHPEDIRWIRNAEVIIQDVGKLKNLCYLEFYFPEVEILEQFTEKSPSWEQIRFNKFKFVVGQNVRRFVDRVSNDVEKKFNEQNRCLRFVNGNNVPQAVIKVLNHVTAVYLDHHLVIRSLSELGITTSKELKFCTVRECPNVEVIIDDNNDEPTYPSLEHLGMHYLWKLESISVNHPPKGSFTSLKSLIVDTCRSLEFIVYESMLQCLYNLEELVVEDCENVKEIVKKSDGMEKDVSSALPSLRKLRLHYLPKLSRFWWRLEGNLEDPVPEGDFKALKSLDVQSCPKLELGSLPSLAEGNVKTRIQKPLGGIIIREPSVTTSPHKRDELAVENKRLKKENIELLA